MNCIDFTWQSFGNRRAVGLFSLRKVQKLSHVKYEPVPDGSKRDPLLARAEPMSDAGCTSVKTYLRRGGDATQ